MHLSVPNSFAVEVARYRDATKYSMMTELDLSAVTPNFATRVRHIVCLDLP